MRVIDDDSMQAATRLVQEGRLTDATVLLQRALPGMPAASPRAGLGATLEQLARHRTGAAPRRAPEPADLVPGGGTWQRGSFAGPHGRRDYGLFLPSRRLAGAAPVLVMLHGCTQTAADFAAGTRMNRAAEAAGCVVVYPEQPATANPQRCWNWFRPEDQARDSGEAALLAGLTRAILAEHRGDRTRTYVAGLSAGGAAALVVAAAWPDLYAGVAVHSGLACGVARDLPSGHAAMRTGAAAGATVPFVPTIVLHGDADRTVHPDNARRIVEQMIKVAPEPLTVERGQGRSDGGRVYTRARHRAGGGRILIEEWMIHGAGHAWSGGSSAGSHTDPAGPDAAAAMLGFLLAHRRG